MCLGLPPSCPPPPPKKKDIFPDLSSSTSLSSLLSSPFCPPIPRLSIVVSSSLPLSCLFSRFLFLARSSSFCLLRSAFIALSSSFLLHCCHHHSFFIAHYRKRTHLFKKSKLTYSSIPSRRIPVVVFRLSSHPHPASFVTFVIAQYHPRLHIPHFTRYYFMFVNIKSRLSCVAFCSPSRYYPFVLTDIIVTSTHNPISIVSPAYFSLLFLRHKMDLRRNPFV